MKTQIEQLGKVCFTIDKNYHDINRDYDKLVIVESYDEGVAYASRKPVPAGTPLTNREYWIKFSSLKEHIQQNYNVIQQELNALYNKVGVGITFSGDYSTFDVGKSKTITLSFATVNAAEKASVVKLYQSDTLMDTYNNISEFTKEVTVSDEVTFRVVATIGNYTYSATWEVTRAYDWYIGGGANHEAVMIDANKHSGTDESISSIQSVNINHSGDHIFICVQKDVFLPEVTMNGFTVPFDAPYTAIVDDVEYNVYKSSNAYTVNTYVLKIDAANWDEDEIFRNLISVVTGFDSETEDLQNRMETAEAVYLRHARQISSIIDRIDPLIERTGGSGNDAQPIRRAPSPWDEYRSMKHIQLLPKEEDGAVLTQEDFTEENAIYVIQHDFTVDDTITIPANCVMEFDGGSLSNGTISNIGKVSNIKDTIIFKGINFINPLKQTVKLNWFGNSSVSDSLIEAAKFGIVDAIGEWNIDKSVIIHNDIEIYNGKFNCLPGIANFDIGTQERVVRTFVGTLDGTSDKIPCDLAGYKAVLIKSDDVYFNNTATGGLREGTCGELMIIDHIEGGYAYFCEHDRLICNYSTNITFTFIKELLNVNFINCEFIAPVDKENANDEQILKIETSIARVEKCSFVGSSTGIIFDICTDSIICNSSFVDTFPWATAFAEGTRNSQIYACNFRGHRHGFSNLGEEAVVKHCVISSNILMECDFGIDTHANAYGLVVENNLFTESKGGISMCAPYSIIKGNVIKNLNGLSNVYGIYLVEAAGINPIIVDNHIDNIVGYGGAIYNVTLNGADTCLFSPKYCVIQNNTISNCQDLSGINVSYENIKDIVVRVILSGNIVINIGYNGIFAKAIECIVENNYVCSTIRNNYPAYRIDSFTDISEDIQRNRNLFIKGNHVTDSVSPHCTVTNFRKVEEYMNTATAYDKMIIEFTSCSFVKRNPSLPSNAGTTTNRPTDYAIPGEMYFDTDLGKPIYYNGTAWVDATGTTV